MESYLAPLFAILAVSAVVWWFTTRPTGRGKHAGGKHARHRVRPREPLHETASQSVARALETTQFDFETAPFIEEPPRSSSFLRITVVILVVALIAALLVWIFGFLLNLQLSRYFGR
ncbi:MAG: hypothetical protein ACRDH6_08870 [Actinomycetota bacterium]